MDWSELGSDVTNSAVFIVWAGATCGGLHALHNSFWRSTTNNQVPRPLEGKVPRPIETIAYAGVTVVAFALTVRAFRNL